MQSFRSWLEVGRILAAYIDSTDKLHFDEIHTPIEIHEIPGVARLIKHKRQFRQVFSRNQRSCVQNSSKVDYTNCKEKNPPSRQTGI
jgi:hypothetical protein